MARKQLAIVGNGMAASRLLDQLVDRQNRGRYGITVFSEEQGGSYNRILLSRVLGGKDANSVTIKTPQWYEEHGVKLMGGSPVTRLDPAGRAIHTADGQSHAYDLVILATGSIPFMPKIEGAMLADGKFKPGVFAYRTLDDCLQIRSSARPGDSAVVLGGGLLGLEAAKALADLGMHVTVVHLLDALMNQQLDKPAAEMLRKQIERGGIFVRTGRTVKSVVGSQSVTGVILDDGSELPADMLVLACGIRPRVDLAKSAGIPVRHGILVNDAMATAIPGVYAIGECAEHDGKIYGLVAPVWEQAEALGGILSGARPQGRYRGSRTYSRLKVAGIEVASMGLIEPELASDEVIQVVEERRHAYRKLIVRDGRLIGAIFVGDTAAAAGLVQLFDRAEPLPANRLSLLCPEPSDAPPAERLVCNCRKVTEGTICSAIADGACTVDEIGSATGAGTGCGSCRSILAR